LAITHSRKAAAELGERLGRLGADQVDARTFHAAGLWVARRFWALTGRREPSPNVLSDREEWLSWREGLRTALRREPDNAEVRDVIDEVGWARSRLVGADDYPTAAEFAGRHAGVEPVAVTKCWELFTASKVKTGRVDFADLLEMASGLVESESEVAQTVRRRWAHVTVDEYQDTDPAQQRLLEAILGEGRDICVVGDPRQAIYSWKGADTTYLSGFARRYPDAKVFNLTRNYRSTPQVLDWANRVASGAGTKALVATRPPGPKPTVSQFDDDQAEAASVAGAARRAIAAGTPPSEIAVLYRFNAAQVRFEAALASANVATVVADDTTFFDREEVRAVLVPFGKTARAYPESNGLERLMSVLTHGGFDRERPPPGLGAAHLRWESQLALLELVESWSGAAGMEARSLLAEVNSLAVRAHGPRTEGVTLATLHKAKGLEWDIVFLVGVTDGAIPSTYAETPAELAEEERLLHVGLTRARRELHLSWATANARGWTNRPSPFLERFVGQPTPPHRSRPPARPARDDETRPASSAECPHCTEPLRGISARRLGVCAHCVTSVPGTLGERARALAEVIHDAACADGVTSEELVGPSALLRLLDQRPGTADGVVATTGVRLSGDWAQAAADTLKV
jgi:DNA helicase-2/ATP-dependent DNA helicase PcrA